MALPIRTQSCEPLKTHNTNLVLLYPVDEGQTQTPVRVPLAAHPVPSSLCACLIEAGSTIQQPPLPCPTTAEPAAEGSQREQAEGERARG